MKTTKEPKTIVYDYLFNYFGGDTFKGKTICGASVQLAIRAYKDGKEVKFTEEPKCKNQFLCDIYKLSFDREKLITIRKDIMVELIFRSFCGWDKIEVEIAGYVLDYYDDMPDNVKEITKDLPENLRNLPCSFPMEVTEEEFKEFLGGHLDDFDISDNKNAQVPSVSFV